uniref:Zinc finger protein 362 n=2 Tax=Cercopithecinae TaxID=9528 RepID=A0A096MWQ2_PAPAN
MSRSSPSGKGHSRMAEPRFNNPYFWPPPPTMPSQLDNLVLINKIKEQLMAEKIRPPHLPPTSASSQQPLLVPPAPAESSQAVMSLPKLQQVPGLHPQAVPQPDVALHARPATSTVTGLGLSTRTPAVSTSESSAGTGTGTGTSTPSTPTTTSQSRLIASSPTLISGITSPPLLDSIKTIQGHGLLGPPKSERGRKKIKAENPGGPPVLVVPYPILASGETAKEGKTYRCKVCPLTFFTKSEMQIHSKSHTEAKPHKCPHCSKSFANASYLAQHLRIHLGVKPYHCSYCDKSFRQLSHLQQHTRIHTGDRPYKCPHPGCEKAFTQLSNLQVSACLPPAHQVAWCPRHPHKGAWEGGGAGEPCSSPDPLLCPHSLTSASTTRTSPTSVPTATGPTRTPPPCRSTSRPMPSSTPRPTAAACVGGPTPR